jgi:hypothetical protein
VLVVLVFVGLIVLFFGLTRDRNPLVVQDEESRMAAALTPTDLRITLKLVPCPGDQVTRVSLRDTQAGVTLWEATTAFPQERFVFVVGQAPEPFVELVELPETLPRGALLEATIRTNQNHTTTFRAADLLPDLWWYQGDYATTEGFEDAVAAAGLCGTVSGDGLNLIALFGFLLAAGAGAWLVARRVV